MAIIRLTNIDSTMPNLALMKLAHYHKSLNDEVHFYTSAKKDLFEPDYDIVYGSSIFTYSQKKRDTFLANFPDAILGGTGYLENIQTVEQIIKQPEYENYDYSIYPDYKWSVGYTQRGCRFKCKFCVVPKKEGDNYGVQTIYDIWREGTERKIHLIDNDFFGQEYWEDRCLEIIEGEFQICLDQGINFRILTDKQIEYLAQINMRNKTFKSKTIYTAWDNLNHEKIFFNGLNRIREAGIKTTLFCYVLIGFKQETDEEIEYRITRLVEQKSIFVYPMIYQNKLNSDYARMRLFRNWVLTRAAYKISFQEFMKQGGDTIKREKPVIKNQLSFEDNNAI